MTATTLARSRPWAAPLVVVVIGVVGATMLTTLRLAGGGSPRAGDPPGGFATDPVSIVALVVGAVIATVVGSRLAATDNRRVAAYALALALSLLAYLALSVWAVWAVAGGHPTASIAVALWNAAWIPPLVLAQLLASASVRLTADRPWEHTVVIAITSIAALASVLLVTASEPFVGVPTIAPHTVATALRPVGGAVTLLGSLALLLIPVRLGRAAIGSAQPARARLGVAAVAAAAAPLTVAFCMLLAIARDPGAVDPSVGSVAFVVALSACAGFAAGCALVATRLGSPTRFLLVILRVVTIATGSLVALALGTLAASPAVAWGASATAIVISAIAVLCVGGSWMLAARLHSALAGRGRPARIQAQDAVDRGPADVGPASGSAHPELKAGAPPAGVPGLTARESEVLAALADGASNAGIAAQLVVSERTVDAHLRAIFVKLELEQEPAVNRRVRASRIWLDRTS